MAPKRPRIGQRHTQAAQESSLEALPSECISQILLFLRQEELCRLEQACLKLKGYCRDERLWKEVVHQVFARNQQQIEAAKAALGLSSYRQQAEAIHKLVIPMSEEGYWASIGDDSNGEPELLNVNWSHNGITAHLMAPHGTQSALFRAKASIRGSGIRVVFFNLEAAGRSSITVVRGAQGAARVGLQRCASGFLLSRNGVMRRFVSVRRPSSLPFPATSGLEAANTFLGGLYTVCFSDLRCEVIFATADVHKPFKRGGDSRIVLRGTKVASEGNEAGGSCRFEIDLSLSYTGTIDWLRQQTTPCLVVCNVSGGVYDLTQRACALSRWCKGRGQVLSEKWIDVDLLVYGNGGDRRFSLMWSEPGKPLKQMVDFKAFVPF